MSDKNTEYTADSWSGMMSMDTTFVLFFLALEYGRAIRMFSFEGAVTGATMLVVLVLPYFLPSAYGRSTLTVWLAGRTTIALLGMLLGAVLNLTIGIVLPEEVRFLPMAGLITATILSFYIQFYTLMKLRPAK